MRPATWNLSVDGKTVVLSTSDLLDRRRLWVRLLAAGLDPPLPDDDHATWLRDLLCRGLLRRVGDAVIGVRVRAAHSAQQANTRREAF